MSTSHRALSFVGKKLVVFDLDKTLSESKTLMSKETGELLEKLLLLAQVSIISGGSFQQFQKQFLPQVRTGAHLKRLSLFPTCGSAFYRYGGGGWENVYTEVLSAQDKKRIFEAFEKMFKEVGFKIPDKIYGELIEDRGTQITFAAYGSQAPIPIKSVWDPNRNKRLKMIEALSRNIPEFEIRTGGTSSIDVTRNGIDKAYGIYQMEKHLGIPVSEMIFVGDDLGEGGNDFPVIATGVQIIAVSGPEHTKEIIRSMIKS